MRASVAAAAILVGVAGCSAHGPPAKTPTAPPSGPPETVLRADQTRVTGTVTSARVVGVGAPLALPFTITVPQRGQGGLTISGVDVAGRAAAVSWDAGQPLPLAGTGSVDLQQVAVDADSGGLTSHLDGGQRLLGPGTYTAGSSVAIGRGGLAQAADGATWVVPAGATGRLVTTGDARVHRAPAPLTMTGPGSVTLAGTLTAETAAGTRAFHEVTLPTGSFELSLKPAPGGYTATCLLQGPVTVT